jgi:phospholipid/cholesterol/gamma-HCH transport system substrate-binding protein
MSTEGKVGAFVITSVLVLGMSVYWVTHTQNVKGQMIFKTYFRYAGGIAPGASVLFGGIKVGQVDVVRSSAEDPTRIEVIFNVKAETPVNENSIARSGTVTVMGSPALMITTGSNDARRLKPGEPVRAEEPTSLDEVARRASAAADAATALMEDLRREIPALTTDARTMLANANKLTGPANQKRIAAILDEFNIMLDRESPKISHITDQISSLTKHADSVLYAAKPIPANVDRAVTKVNDLLDAVREPLTKDLTDIQAVIQQARETLADVQDVVGENRQEMAETVQNLRAASENVRALTETLKQRPWNLIRTTQPVDRKVPQ